MFDTLADRIANHAREMPDRRAVRCGDQAVSWAEFDAGLDRVASGLASLGIGRGDKVAAIGRNSIQYLTAFLGTLRAGACIVPLPTMAAPDALERMLVDCGARAVFSSNEKSGVIDSIVAGNAAIPVRGLIGLDFGAQGWLPLSGWLAAAEKTPFRTNVEPDDHFNIIYSSGTTGTPKGILHTHAMREALIKRTLGFDLDRECISLCSTPLYSNTTLALLLGTLAAGATTILMGKFDALEYLKIAEAERVTHTILVPVQYQRLLSHPDFDRFDLSSFKWKLSTSAPLAAHIKRDVARRWGGRMLDSYGMTEGGLSAMLMVNEFPDKLHTVGRPPAGCEIVTLDPQGKLLPPTSAGELAGFQPGMMTGYFNNPEQTAALKWQHPDGRIFNRSGDVGYFDEDGFLVLLDRIKDVIISGGFNIYAADIERVILQHPAVAEAAVIGVPSTEWGETPLAVVVPRDGIAVDADELRAFTNERLGRLQHLSAVEFRSVLPRSEIGKILKRELRAPYWSEPNQPPQA